MPYEAPIFDVNVDVTLSHTASDDLDLLLLGLHGQQVLLTADSGSSFDATHVELRFHDEAAIPLPDRGQLSTVLHTLDTPSSSLLWADHRVWWRTHHSQGEDNAHQPVPRC